MENSQQNEILQVKNLITELNNNINQINDKIITINNIITQINAIMLNNINNKSNQINNFMKIMTSFNPSFKDYNFNANNDILQKFFPIKNEKKLEELNEEKFEEDIIEAVMKEGNTTREKAIKALKMHGGDPVEALLEVGYEQNEEKNSKEKEKELKENFDQEQESLIKTVVEEGKCSREDAIKALENHRWDPVEALLEVGI